jgi:TMEM175 potassium channel family protein
LVEKCHNRTPALQQRPPVRWLGSFHDSRKAPHLFDWYHRHRSPTRRFATQVRVGDFASGRSAINSSGYYAEEILGRGRLEAFSDGVIAILITLLVLQLKVPHSTDPADLLPIVPIFLSYLLSFIYLGIYWSNHHHLLHATERVTGGILWANLHLLLWLSLIPFVTAWMRENHFASTPTALYGFVLLMEAVAYWVLQRVIIADQGDQSFCPVPSERTRKVNFRPQSMPPRSSSPFTMNGLLKRCTRWSLLCGSFQTAGLCARCGSRMERSEQK